MPTPKWAKEEIEQAKDYVVEIDNKLESVADDALDRGKAAKHTWVAIAGVVAAITVVLGFLLAF